MDDPPSPSTHYRWQVQAPTFTAVVVVTGGEGRGRIVDAAPLLRQWVGRPFEDLFRFCKQTSFALVYVGPDPFQPEAQRSTA